MKWKKSKNYVEKFFSFLDDMGEIVILFMFLVFIIVVVVFVTKAGKRAMNEINEELIFLENERKEEIERVKEDVKKYGYTLYRDGMEVDIDNLYLGYYIMTKDDESKKIFLTR